MMAIAIGRFLSHSMPAIKQLDAHQVKDRLLASQHRINDVTVHIEPWQPSRGYRSASS